MKDVEILIVGGGPAGLLAASYLAERHRVALIERAALGKTTKYWVTTERRLRNHDLAHCQLSRARGIVVGTFLGSRARAEGDLAVVDEGLLLKELADRCRRRGVLVSEQCALINLAWTEGRIHAQATCETYRTRLVVDATGASSPIASTFRLHRLDGFFAVFGAHLRSIKLRGKEVVLAYAHALGDPPPILEVIPTGESSAFCSVFTYSRLLSAPGSLEAAFQRQCLHNPFFETSTHTETVQTKMGVIAIGRCRSRELPGVVSIGEAGLIQPPLLGTAFNEILEHTEFICTEISEMLSRAPGLPQSPRIRYPLLKRTQDRLQLTLARILLRGNVEAFDWLVRFVNALPPEVVFRLCSNELTRADLVRIVAQLPRHLFARRRHVPVNHDSQAASETGWPS